MKLTKFIWGILYTGCIIGSGVAGFLMQKNKQATPEPDISIQRENTTVQTDPLSLRLFQHALQNQAGNVLVAPRGVCELLHLLHPIVGGKTKEELESIQLPVISANFLSGSSSFALLAADVNLPRTENKHQILALPFSENYPLALSMFNGLLADYTPHPNLQLATSDMTSNRTRLLAGYVSFYRTNWKNPFYQTNSRLSDFDNASGSMPDIYQMRSRGRYHIASSSDGSWQAVAIPLRTASKQNELMFVCIMPVGSARSFAAGLTPESLSDIRLTLLQAAPVDTLVELPRFEQMQITQDTRHTLRRLGLNSLFSQEHADFSPLTPEKIHLNALVQSSGISVRESESPISPTDDNALENAMQQITFSRPFVWFIADAASPAPMEFMGLVEEL